MKGQITKYDVAYYSDHDGLHFGIGNFECWLSYYNKPHWVTAEEKKGCFIDHKQFADLEDALCDLRLRNRKALEQ